MKVELISAPADAERLCGMAAAVCTDSKNTDSALRHAVESGHTSVLEHAAFTFRISGLSRAALAQLTRHRLASYSVQSQRFVKLDEPELVIPDTIRNSKYAEEVAMAMKYVMGIYKRMERDGIPIEDCRYITPQAVPTVLIVTMNARELLHFFSLRCCNRAQWEIRQLADEMLRLCKKICPLLFRHAGPGCVNSVCPEKRPCGSPRQVNEWEAEGQ